jgi:hypothetical protein
MQHDSGMKNFFSFISILANEESINPKLHDETFLLKIQQLLEDQELMQIALTLHDAASTADPINTSCISSSSEPRNEAKGTSNIDIKKLEEKIPSVKQLDDAVIKIKTFESTRCSPKLIISCLAVYRSLLKVSAAEKRPLIIFFCASW